MAILVGTETCEARDDLTDGQILHGSPGLGDQLIEAGGGGVRAVLVLDVDGRRPDDGVAVDGRADEDALAIFPGELEDRVLCKVAGRLVEQAIVAAARRDMQLARADLIVQHVGVDARRVDDGACLKRAAVRLNDPMAIFGADGGDFCVKLEANAVGGGVFRQGDGQAEGTDDRAGRRPEGRDRIRRDVRLKFAQAVPLDNLKTGHAVFHAVFIERVQARSLRFRHADDEAAAAAIWEVQFTGQRLHQLAAAQIEFCHQAAVRGVEARMDDGAVGLAGAAADVLLALEHEEAALTAAQVAGDGAARHARADNDHIIHKITSK